MTVGDAGATLQSGTWLGTTHAKSHQNRLIRYKGPTFGGAAPLPQGRIWREIWNSANGYQFPHNEAQFVSNFIKIGQLFRKAPQGDNSALSWREGGWPRGLSPKIKIVDLVILFPHIWNRIPNFSIVLESFAFIHFGSASDKTPLLPRRGEWGEIWISDRSNPFPHE